MTPTVSVSATGSGDSVAITVYGDPSASVVLYHQNYGSAVQPQYLGSTNSGGYLSATISSATYGISAGNLVYVMVNNQTSSSIAWPSSYNNYNYGNYNYGNNYGTLTLSQTSASITVGQAMSITIYGGTAPYTMYPSGANIFQAVISGNTLQVTGLANGTGSLNVCSSGGQGSGCVVLYVTVGSSYYYGGGTNYYGGGQISLSQNNLSLNAGASTIVTMYGNGGYYIGSNTNSNIASAYVSGSTINVSGVSYGSDTISICQSGGQCASLYVSVGYGSTGYNNSVPQPPIVFSQNNPMLSLGQSMAITVSSGTANNYYSIGNYSVVYNSNASSLSAVLSGNSLVIQGLANGNTAIVVCSTSNNCSALNVTVGATVYYATAGGGTICASENGFCSFAGTQNVRYGANGAYVYKLITGGTTCSNAVFGDPIYGVAKQCSIGY